MNNDLTIIKRKILPVLKKHGVLRAGIFGSYARGEQKKGSDIDILVKTRKTVSLFGFVGIKLEAEKILGKKVDLVEYSALKPRLRENILKDEVRIL
ncbi:MAG TPA: nucleotidyltransferase family protein [Candidatus Nanoarchaeia archaeon]|nr:nucleotidyltransferase family protein [Candidatus Nanoarchaeia archaeon]